MVDVTDAELDKLLAEAMDELSREHMAAVKNLAIVWADEPTPEERVALQLSPNQTLFGLYQGVPLPQRQGRINDFPPGKITIYRGPITRDAMSIADLKERLKHTLWHEIAHYFGLNHDQINNLEG